MSIRPGDARGGAETDDVLPGSDLDAGELRALRLDGGRRARWCLDLPHGVSGAGIGGLGHAYAVVDSPGVLVGAAEPVVGVDVLADDRPAGIAGEKRAVRAERVGPHVVVAAQREHVGSTAISSIGWPALRSIMVAVVPPPLIPPHGGP